jgi:hypothetical protein
MIQIIMLVVGVYYAYRLLTLSSAGLNFGMHPEALIQWRAQKKQQYLWGIAAGWGSLVLGLGAMFVVTATTRTCAFGDYCYSDTGAASVWMLLVTLAVLIVGIALSVMANNKAKALQRTGMNPFGGQGVQPGWGQPPVQQPGWGQPPVQQPGWGQPPAAQPGWGQPPAAQPGWGQPPVPAAPPAWGQPPVPQPGWGAPAAPPAWGQPPVPPAPPAWGAPAAPPAAPADSPTAPTQPDVAPTDPPVA